jgi:hypothetical protein
LQQWHPAACLPATTTTHRRPTDAVWCPPNILPLLITEFFKKTKYMKQQIKYVQYTIIACTLIAAFYGCKREAPAAGSDALQTSGLQKLQAWYQSQPATQGLKNTSAKLPAADIQWDRAVYNAADKGWAAPMAIKKSGKGSSAFMFFTASQDAAGSIGQGGYAMVIPDNAKMRAANIQNFAVTPGMLAFATVPAGFSGAIIQYDMDKALVKASYYQGGVLQPGTAARLAAKSESSSTDAAPDPSVVDQCQGAPMV